LHRIISGIAVVACAILIFMFSQQPVHISRDLSVRVTEFIIQWMHIWNPDHAYTVADLHKLVRKCAHVLLYFAFGMLLLHALSVRKGPTSRLMLLTGLACLIYAITDEWHQLYVPGRGAQWQDVIIDTAGAILGILLYKLVHLLFRGRGKRD